MDEEAFDAFYAESFNRLVGQLTAIIGDRTEAQDCVQEAFVRAWDQRRKLDTSQSPEAWVRTVAHRLAVSRWRRVMRGRRPADRAVEPIPQPSTPSPDRVALERALAQISPDQRRALVLHHYADLSVNEIAEELKVPVGTVKARLSRGRAALAALLNDAPLETRHV
ncbi:RNA polymerase sigma factor [Aestuariimicrobium ganziense]|uniref:RNA polymerase sigma factor n=1 Tax=Aestuariimicrobium ganziense TaxID=2773677 RepID=UPI00194533F7|nr:SigE family RNA polymerase sigma factor [Aestuariimicrobium ganziense]